KHTGSSSAGRLIMPLRPHTPDLTIAHDSCGTYLLRADGLRGNRPLGASGPSVPRPDCWTMR
ncbi:MAG: hypothetical protein VB138_13860, partial [Burkholderia sp.]